MKKTFLFFASLILFSCSNNEEEENNTPNASIPVLTTNAISNINLVSASSGGNITTDGGANITARGVIWSTLPNPTISLITKTTDGVGIGIFTSNITSLTPNTTYYVRAYATNSAGTAYGNEISFITTSIQLPVLTTTTISNITLSTASSGGNITSDGGGAITARGVVWSTALNPTVALSTKTTDGLGTVAFTSNITGLTANTQYYVRAYATNSAGTAYGNEVSFTTLTPNYAAMYPTGTVYCNNVVTAVVDVTNPITGKTWMDRNLGSRPETYSYSTSGALDTNSHLYQWGRRADGHQCRNSVITTSLSTTNQPSHANFIIYNQWGLSDYYGNRDWLSTQNGNLWQGVNGVNNPCPVGYRLPTETELNNERLSWGSQNQNSYGAQIWINMTKGGSRGGATGSISTQTTMAYYWTSTVSGIYSRALGLTSQYAVMYDGYRADGGSVRCIKN
jgi:uncharacterized protein (TIGR02145 family)